MPFNPARQLTFVGLLLYCVLSLGSMATMSIGIGVFLILFVADGWRRGSFGEELRWIWANPRFRAFLLAATALGLSIALSLILAKAAPLLYAGKGPEVTLPRDFGKVWYVFLPLVWVLAWRRLSEGDERRVLQVWFTAFAALSMLGLVQFFTGFPRGQPNPLLAHRYHVVLLLGHHLSLASVWIFPFFGLLDLASRPASLRHLGLRRWLVGIGLGFGLFCLFYSYSRTLWAALPVGLAALALLRLSGRARFAAIAAVAIAVGGVLLKPEFRLRLTHPMGIEERVELWKANLEMFKARPVLGVGYGKNPEVAAHYFEEKFPEDYKTRFVGHAHNLFLEILAGTGIVGFVSWLAWFGMALAPLLAFRRSDASDRPWEFRLGLLCAWGVFVLNSLTQVNFWESKVLHQVTWIAGLTLFWASREPKAEDRPAT